MSSAPEKFERRLKLASDASVMLCVLLIAGVCLLMFWKTRRVDGRLIGTWQSDADRTILQILGPPPYDQEKTKRESKLRNLFGNMRITYTDRSYTTSFQGTVETVPYEVLGSDKVSVVIRSLSKGPSPLDVLELSSFQIIRFEGTDYYQIHSEAGGLVEVFRRVR